MESNEKLIRNEKLLRERNQVAAEAIKKYYHNEDGIENEEIEFICECSDLSCQQVVPLSIKEYEKIHKRKNRFVLVKGHENPKVENVTDIKPAFKIVEKPQLAE